MVAPSKYALLNAQNVCVNVVLWDGDTTTWDPAPYTAVPYNPAVHVIAVPLEEQNRATITANAVGALTGNRTYIALASPTVAQTNAQVKALSRQNNSLIRLLLNQLDGVE